MPIAKRARWSVVGAFLVASTLAGPAIAAGSVSMQIEHLIRQALAEYNSAGEEGDSAAFVKYFASNARYESPLFRYSTRAELARHFEAEFKAYRPRFQVHKMFVQDNAAAVVLTWNAVDRASSEAIKLDMVGLFEVGSSAQFSSAVFYYDSAQAKALTRLSN
jgi:hypothetical protein